MIHLLLYQTEIIKIIKLPENELLSSLNLNPEASDRDGSNASYISPNIKIIFVISDMVYDVDMSDLNQYSTTICLFSFNNNDIV